MNIPIILGLIAILGSIYLWIGKKASQNLSNRDQYFLMGRRLSFVPLVLTLLATQLGGGTLIGAAQEAYSRGVVVLLYPLGVFLGLMALSLGFGKRLREQNVTTIAEIFEKVYGSRIQRIISALFSITTLFIILVTQAMAARAFFSALGFSSVWILAALWFMLVAYTVMGGLKAVVNTDVLQALFIIAGLVIALFSIDFSLFSFSNFPPLQKEENLPWVSWILMPLLFMLIEQDTGQRCFAAKSSKTITRASFTAAIFLLCSSSIAIFIGIAARNAGIASSDASILIIAVQTLTNPYVTSFFMVAILLAIISTADTLLCSIASNISCDIFRFDQTKGIQSGRVLTLIIGCISLLVSYYFSNVVYLLMFSYELCVSTLFIPTVLTVLSKTPSKRGSLISMLVGFLAFFLFRQYQCIIPKEILILVSSLMGYMSGNIGEYLGKKRVHLLKK